MAGVLAESNELAAMLAASPAALITLSCDGIVLHANPAATRLLNRSAEDLEGQHWHHWVPAIDATRTRGRIERRLMAASGTTTGDPDPIDLVTGDGTSRSVSMSCSDYRHGGERRIVVSLAPLVMSGAATGAVDPDNAFANEILVDKSAVGMTLTDPQGRWLRVNNAYSVMLGYTVDELLNMGFADVTHPDDVATDQRSLADLNAGRLTEFSHEKRYIHRDGSIFWVRIHVNGVYDSGQLIYYAAQVINIDAQHRVAEENRLLQNGLQSFVDHVPAHITMKDADGRFTLVNERFAQAVNRDQNSFIGQTFASMHIKGAAVTESVADEGRILRSGEIIDREVASPWSSESVMWVTRFPVHGDSGSIIGTGSIATDITESKRNEQELLAQARTIGLLQRVAVAANEAIGSRAAMEACLKLVCQYMDWPCGHVAEPNPRILQLQSTGIYCGVPVGNPGPEPERRLRDYSRAFGEGIAGRAWQSGAPTDDFNPGEDSPWPDSEINGGVAFPIELEEDIVAVFEFFGPEPIELDDRTREVLAFVGVQVSYAIRRENTERSAARALERLSYHMDNSAVGVVEVDRDLRISGWSPHCEALFGWHESEVVGKTTEEIGFIHPEDNHLVAEVFGKLDDPGLTSYDLFHRNITKSGEVVYIDWFNSVLRDDNDGVVSNLGIAVDRTAEVRARQALDEERQIFVSGPTMVMRWGDEPGWPITYASPNVEEILGYTIDEFAGGSVRGIDFIHPDDIALLEREIDAFLRSAEPQWAIEPFRAITKSGSTIWVKTYISRPRDSGSQGDYIAYLVDITETVELQEETRRQEDLLRSVIEGTDAGTWEWHLDTGNTVLNERWAAMIGYGLEELQPLTIDKWARMTHPADLVHSNRLRKDNFTGRTESFTYDCRVQHKDGSWVWVHDRGKVVERKADGTPLRVAGIRLDVTDQKEAESAVLETNDALKRSNVELERFAYVASHDLQEPLRMVAGFTQLLKTKYSTELDDTAQEYIHFAFDGAQRMQRLIRDLLSYSRLGRQEIEETPVDAAALVARVGQALQLSIEEHDARIDCAELPIVRADAGQLYQLLQNLIGNALKYHGEKRPLIQVFTELKEGERVFCVRDNGIGIAPEQSERVFEIFQRLHSRAEYAGTGIGLSICKRIVERHGGRIWFESAPGEGSVFYFTLAAERYSAPTESSPVRSVA